MGQDTRAGELLSSSESKVHLALPAVCVMEAISAFNRKRGDRKDFKAELAQQLRDLRRSIDVSYAQQLVTELTQADLTNDKLLNALFHRLDSTLLGIANRAQLIPISAEIIQVQIQLSGQTELDRADALILASILADSKRESTDRKAFLSGNFKDFEEEPVKLLLAQAGIKQFRSIGRLLSWIEVG